MKHLLTLNKKTSHSLSILLLLLLFTLPAFAAEGTLVESLKNYPVSVHWESVELPLLFKAISRQTGITIYPAENIKDTISIEMQDRTLYDVFQLVMEAKDLKYFEKNGLIFIQKEEDYASRQKGVVIERLCTKFGSAADYESQLAVLLSDTGSITIADRGNCLVIKDQTDNLDRIKTVLGELDKPIPQVYIEARIVVISQEAKKRLGIKWGFTNTYTVDGRDLNVTFASDQSVVNNTSLEIGFVKSPLNLTMELQALQQEDLLQILSSPSVLVLDGKEAEIKQGKEVAYVTQTDNTISTSFREANLGLKVTPKILKDKYIVLDLSVTNDSVSDTSTGDQPTIDTQEITSTLFLENGVTVVIGGIQLKNSSINKGKVPMLSELPLLGSLFKSKSDTNTNYELQVFITPTIVSMRDEIPYFSKKKNEEELRPAPATNAVVVDTAINEKIQAPAASPTTPPAVIEEPAIPAVSPTTPPAAIEKTEPRKIQLIGEDQPRKIVVKARPAATVASLPDQPPAAATAAANGATEPAATETGPGAEAYLYSVQVGAFVLKEDAAQMQNELQAKGYTAFLAEFTAHDNKSWYTVRIGKFNDWTTASATASEYIKNEKKPAVVRSRESL